VLIGASLAGILGALAAIPVAGTIQVVLLDWLRHHRGTIEPASTREAAEVAEPAKTPL
jgi:predicted PurR-regulated permease PerM